MKTLKVFEAFAGYGSQSIALENLGINHEVVGIAEVDADAIISHAAIRGFDLDVDNDNFDDIVQNMLDSNVAYDFKKGKSKLPRMNKKKKKQLANANVAVKNFGDISLLDPSELPDFDLFTYSFPCQDLSVYWANTRLGLDGKRSSLLYECEKVIETKRPKYLLLENVKDLAGTKFKHNFDAWLQYLESLGYTNYWKVLNAKDYGVPQNRERVFVVSVLGNHTSYVFQGATPLNKTIADVMVDNVDNSFYYDKAFVLVNKSNQAAELTIRGHESLRRVQSPDMICPTLTTMEGGYREPKVLVNNRIRKLTPLECWRLMGMSDEHFKLAEKHVSNSQLYKQAGNSIVVDVLEAIFEPLLRDYK